MTKKGLLRRSASFSVVLTLLFSLCGPGSAQAPPAAKLIVTNAYIFSMAAEQRAPFLGYLVVRQDGRLLTVAAGEAPSSLKATTVWNADGRWVMPGFISAHSHLWQSAYRGLASDQTLLGWIDALYGKRVAHATAEDLYWFTLEGALDHLRHGVTAAYNFNYGGHAPAQREEFSEQEFRGEMDSGFRFVHGWEPGRAGTTETLDEARPRLKTFLDWTAKQKNDRLLAVMINGGTAFDGTSKQAVMEAALMKEF